MATLSLGIDIGGSSVKAALVREMEVVTTARSDCYDRPSRKALVAAIAQAVELVRGGESAKHLTSVGICCPGILDRERKTITLSVNVPALVGAPLDDLVREAIGLRRLPAELAILSDANAVGYDIHAAEELKGRLLCLSLGTGVGASVVDDWSGQRVFLRVSGESPGHFGQLDVSLDDSAPMGPDGGRGSLEAYIGASALMARYGSANVVEKLTVAEPPVRALIRALRIGHAMYRPNHVCLAGGVGMRLAHLTDAIRAGVADQLTSVAREGWRLFTGTSDYHAACGVARWGATRG